MSNSIGNNVILTIFGESHGPEIGAVLDGMAPGIEISEEEIASWLSKRRPKDASDTARREPDKFRVVSGIFNGHTTGAPICIIIPNENTRSSDYEQTHGLARPSHADYTANVKYNGFEDYRGGGHFSGRMTAGIAAAGAIALKALKSKGIEVGTHILCCGGIYDVPFSENYTDENAMTTGNTLLDEIKTVNGSDFPVLAQVEEQMREVILRAKASDDSVGGIVQTAVAGLPAGIGSPWFDSVEGCLSKAVFAIGGVKGIEFGAGFSIAGMRGSEANDPFFMDNGKVRTRTNHSGGINGGISNGMPIIFNTAVKPTPSIAQPQQTIDFKNGTDAILNLKGRHDPAIVRRICPVITSITAIVICDLLAMEYGTNWLSIK